MQPHSVAYVQCSGPEFHQGTYCPVDGSGSSVTDNLRLVVERLRDSKIDLTHDTLRLAWIPESVLAGVIIVTFPSSESAWRYFVPVRSPVCKSCSEVMQTLRLASPGAQRHFDEGR